MSTRSPMNPRSQSREGKGFARKSASSAKPARAAAGSVRVEPSSSKARRKSLEKGEDLSNLSKEEKRARKQQMRAQEDRVYSATNILMKSDEDYLKRRRVWWVLLGVGMGVILLLWVWLFAGGKGGDITSAAQVAVIVVAYVIIIAAFVYDFARIRPLRNLYRTRAEGMSERALIALIEKSAAEDDRKRAEREAAKAAKKNK